MIERIQQPVLAILQRQKLPVYILNDILVYDTRTSIWQWQCQWQFVTPLPVAEF
jgi:hypothetical protein